MLVVAYIHYFTRVPKWWWISWNSIKKSFPLSIFWFSKIEFMYGSRVSAWFFPFIHDFFFSNNTFVCLSKPLMVTNFVLKISLIMKWWIYIYLLDFNWLETILFFHAQNVLCPVKTLQSDSFSFWCCEIKYREILFPRLFIRKEWTCILSQFQYAQIHAILIFCAIWGVDELRFKKF